MLYIPSILAAATMLHVIKEVEPCHYLEYQKELIGVLKTCEVCTQLLGVLFLEILLPVVFHRLFWNLIVHWLIVDLFQQDKVNACYKLILELLESHCKGNQGHKRKHRSIPSSPNGVIDASFSCDSSDDSWAVTSSVSSSPHPLFKRSRAHDQKMRLPSPNRMFVDVLSIPR